MEKYEDYMVKENELLIIMRLIVEGSLAFFENTSTTVYSLLVQNGQKEKALDFDNIGAGLVELRRFIATMQEEQRKTWS